MIPGHTVKWLRFDLVRGSNGTVKCTSEKLNEQKTKWQVNKIPCESHTTGLFSESPLGGNVS